MELTAARPAAHPLPSQAPLWGGIQAQTPPARQMEGLTLDIQDGGREPGMPWPSPRQAGREQAGREHSGLLATQAEAAVAAEAGPEQGGGAPVGQEPGPPRPMSASHPW